MTRLVRIAVGLVLAGSGGSARANDLADSVEWLHEQGAEALAPGLGDASEGASDHAALAMLNSRDVRAGQDLDAYRCEDAPIDGFATMRTSGEQAWALRACQEKMWRRDRLPGFVTLGPIQLSATEIEAWVARASRETDVPAKLIDTIVRYVSGYRPGVVSERGHLGLMQLRPKVLAELGIAHGDLLDPQENLRAGARYLRRLTFDHGGLKWALAAYRDGPAVLAASGGKFPSERRYLWFVREVMKIYFGSVREFPTEIGAESMSFVWGWLD